MEIFMYLVVMAIGATISKLFFPTTVVGAFEENIMYQIRSGKRIVVSVDEECYIFKMHGGKVRVTRGTATYLEEEIDELQSIGLDNINTDQSIDNLEVGSGSV